MASIYLSTPRITPKHTIRIYEVYNGYVFVLLMSTTHTSIKLSLEKKSRIY